MPAPYSYDLRKKAIKAVKEGQRKVDICRVLNISRNTLDLWLKREKETGDCKAIENYQKGKPQKIKYLSEFEKFAKNHQDKSQTEIAELWGDNLTQQNVSYAYRRLGITRKKNIRL